MSFQIALPDIEPQKTLDDPTLTFTAYDLGRENMATFHDGASLKTVRIEQRYRNEVKEAQRAVARCKLGSKGRRKKKLILIRIKHKEANARNTYLHQTACAIVNKADVIGVDALAVKQMTRKKEENTKKERAMNLSNLDAGYSSLNAKVRYKAARAGKRTVDYEPAYTSQDCAMCWSHGVLTRRKKKREERRHLCHACGFAEHRDVNGSLNGFGKAHGVNILKEFMELKYGLFPFFMGMANEGVEVLGFDAVAKGVRTYAVDGS